MNIITSDSSKNEEKGPVSPNALSETTTFVPSTPTSPSSASDLSDDVNKVVPGWPALAKLISERPALESFPSFADLNIKSLLYYQAELISLRKDLHKAEWADHRTSDEEDSSKFADALDFLLICGNSEEKPEQWELIERIRIVLEKYNTALIQYSQISALPGADSVNVRSLKECVKRICEDCLSGSGAFTWGRLSGTTEIEKSLPSLIWGLITGFFKSPYSEREKVDKEWPEHLIVPRTGRKPDGLTLWVAHSFLPLYHHLRNTYRELHKKMPELPKWNSPQASKKPKELPDRTLKHNLTAYSENWILRVTSILTTVVACLLPTVAISILARVHTMSMILGLIALFTAIFAVGLVLLSSGSSRVEIFTATAAFSAVMVVFVQNKIQDATNT